MKYCLGNIVRLLLAFYIFWKLRLNMSNNQGDSTSVRLLHPSEYKLLVPTLNMWQHEACFSTLSSPCLHLALASIVTRSSSNMYPTLQPFAARLRGKCEASLSHWSSVLPEITSVSTRPSFWPGGWKLFDCWTTVAWKICQWCRNSSRRMECFSSENEVNKNK